MWNGEVIVNAFKFDVASPHFSLILNLGTRR